MLPTEGYLYAKNVSINFNRGLDRNQVQLELCSVIINN